MLIQWSAGLFWIGPRWLAVRKPGRSQIQRIAVYDVGGEPSPCKASPQLTAALATLEPKRT